MAKSAFNGTAGGYIESHKLNHKKGATVYSLNENMNIEN